MRLGFESWNLTSILQRTTKQSTTVAYEPLLVNHDTIEKDEPHLQHPLARGNHSCCKLSAIFCLIFLIGFIAGVAIARFGVWDVIGSTSLAPAPLLVYSPAHSVLSYEVRRFNASFGTEVTEYQGSPSDALDERWHDLYRYGISQIPTNEAKNLVDKTVPIPGDEDNYIVSLEIFHQLHCLNLLRKSLYPGHYPTEELWHLEHCVDIIRQSLSCNIDITPVYWRWSGHKTVAKMDGAHQCTNFASIQQWAYDHQLRTKFDASINLELGHEGHPVDNTVF